MFDTAWMDELDGTSAADAVVAAHTGLLEAEARLLYLAAHWADLHNGDVTDASGGVLPGMERSKQLGAAGTPRVMEFATVEFGALQGMGFISADNLVRDALNLRHRHPVLWAAVFAGKARVWQAREVARMAAAAELSAEQAGWVDAVTTARLASLPWGRFLGLVEAKIIEADPAAAEARRLAAELERFVRTGRSTEYGLKTLVARAGAGDVIFFVAMTDRIAQILLAEGDSSPVDVRRSQAIGILANPARALAMLERHATTPPSSAADPADGPTDGCPTGDPAGAGDPGDGSAECEGDSSEDAELILESDLHPADNDADDPTPAPGPVAGDASGFVQPVRLDPRKLLPAATLYVHLAQDCFTRDRDVM